MFAHETAIRLHHTDAAGVMFYARLFELMHEAFEEMLDQIGYPLPEDLADADIGYPIVHAEAHYRQPMRLGNRVTVHIDVLEIRPHSFMLQYRFALPDGRVAAKARTAHAAVHNNGTTAHLPTSFKTALAELKNAGQHAVSERD